MRVGPFLIAAMLYGSIQVGAVVDAFGAAQRACAFSTCCTARSLLACGYGLVHHYRRRARLSVLSGRARSTAPLAEEEGGATGRRADGRSSACWLLTLQRLLTRTKRRQLTLTPAAPDFPGSYATRRGIEDAGKLSDQPPVAAAALQHALEAPVVATVAPKLERASAVKRRQCRERVHRVVGAERQRVEAHRIQRAEDCSEALQGTSSRTRRAPDDPPAQGDSQAWVISSPCEESCELPSCRARRLLHHRGARGGPSAECFLAVPNATAQPPGLPLSPLLLAKNQRERLYPRDPRDGAQTRRRRRTHRAAPPGRKSPPCAPSQHRNQAPGAESTP